MNEKDIVKYLERIGALITDTLVNQLLKYNTTDKNGKKYTLKNSRIIRNMYHKVEQKSKSDYTLTIFIEKYGIYIDEGRKPGTMPPAGPIKEWMNRHNIPESALYPIRKKISIRGVDKRPFISMATKRITAVKDIFKNSLPEQINIDLEKLIERLEKSRGN
jgi:hypothetical protein